MPGFARWLAELGWAERRADVVRWCEEQGAAELGELAENFDDLCSALGVAVEELERLRPLAAAAAAPESKPTPPTLASARSVPITTGELRSVRVVPAEAWRARSSPPLSRTGTALSRASPSVLDDAREAAAHAAAARDEALDHEAPGPRRDLVALGWDRKIYNRRWYQPDAWLLRQRIPTDAELNAVDNALSQQRAKLQQMYGAEEEFQKAKVPGNKAFEAMRDNFEERYGENVKSELQQTYGQAFKLVPADLAPKAQDRFMNSVKQGGDPMYGYHGTRKEAIPHILDRGLLVPGAESGVRVHNGAAHGVGVYTAMPGSSWLSRGFAEGPNMLICGIVDPAAEPVPSLAAPTVPAQRAQAASRAAIQHKSHHRPGALATAPAPALPSAVFHRDTQRESESVKVVGAARILFKNDLAAPLFVAQPVSAEETFERAGNVPVVQPKVAQQAKVADGPGYRGGSRQIYLAETNRRYWIAGDSDDSGIPAKRRFEQKKRQQLRGQLREEKQAAMFGS